MIKTTISKTILLATLSISGLAAAQTPVFNGVDEVCGARIAEEVTKAATLRYGADTMETFSILDVSLNEAGSQGYSMLRLFNVSSSDEVGQSRWLVVTDDEDCLIEYIGIGDEN
jgi:hypothetical protein